MMTMKRSVKRNMTIRSMGKETMREAQATLETEVPLELVVLMKTIKKTTKRTLLAMTKMMKGSAMTNSLIWKKTLKEERLNKIIILMKICKVDLKQLGQLKDSKVISCSTCKVNLREQRTRLWLMRVDWLATTPLWLMVVLILPTYLKSVEEVQTAQGLTQLDRLDPQLLEEVPEELPIITIMRSAKGRLHRGRGEATNSKTSSTLI